MEAIIHLDRSESAMQTNQTDDDKFVCKFCKKRFTCGKSLGGHIRIHFNKSSKRSNRDKQDEFNTSKVVNGGGQYGLRENPKKSTRFVLDSSIDGDCLLCKECGKGFQSLKALCGHMACHSKNNSFDDQSGSSDKIRDMVMVMDGYSDTETSSPSNRRRSKRIRYKAVDPNYSSSLTSIANGDSLWDSDTEQEEQEEVAMCLMMLSRDSGNFSPVDRNSVVVGDKLSGRLGISSKNGVDSVNNEVWGRLELKKVKDKDWFENSGSDHLQNEVNRVKSNEPKKRKLGYGSKSDREFDAEFIERLRGSKKIRTSSNDYDDDETDDDQIDQDCSFASMKQDSSNGQSKSNSSLRPKTNEDQGKFPSIRVKIPAGHVMNSSSKSKKKWSSRRGKVHKCPFCPKIFKSGQALGGHKRSHFIGSGEDRTFVIKEDECPDPEVPIPSLIDLNLPPDEEDTNESMGL